MPDRRPPPCLALLALALVYAVAACTPTPDRPVEATAWSEAGAGPGAEAGPGASSGSSDEASPGASRGRSDEVGLDAERGPGAGASPAANSNTPLLLACAPDNDLAAVLAANGVPHRRVDTPAAALAEAPPGSAVLLLADGYPTTPTALDPALFDAAAARDLRLFVEFPATLPELTVGAVRAADLERVVVASDAFGPDLEPLRLVVAHDAHWLPVSPAPPTADLVVATVAGYDTAAYGLDDVEAQALLFEHPGRPDLLVATTKLSQFVTARYAPQAAWQAIWRRVLAWLQPDHAPPTLAWTPTVRPSFARDEPLPADAARTAVRRGIDWHRNARMLIHEDWAPLYDSYRQSGVVDPAHPVGPAPDPSWPVGDGRHGLLEGVQSTIAHDGSQTVRWWRRSDSNGESALAFALAARLHGRPEDAAVAAHLLDWVFETSGLYQDDPSADDFGLIHWAADSSALYGDNDVKVLLSAIGTAALLDDDRWDERLLRCVVANFRTTGRLGFRGGSLSPEGLARGGWPAAWRGWTTHYAPHFEAWIWSTYLWAHDKTGDPLLLERTRAAIGRMMAAYPDGWRWTNGIQQERGRMLLPLAWLVRVDGRPEHRAWLRRIAEDMAEDQDASGAIREELGDLSMGLFRPPPSNAAYGHNEASAIHANGDPMADLLYTCNFTFLGLHEAHAATGEALYGEMADRLAEFLVRIQVRSEEHPELDGGWFRTFDHDKWEFWGADADHGWGAWSIEVGWTQGWVTSVLALRALGLNLWDLSADSDVARHWPAVKAEMLPEALIALPEPRRVDHAGRGAAVTLGQPAHPSYPGAGPATLSDGVLGEDGHQSPHWLGFLGEDLQATLTLDQPATLGAVELTCLVSRSVGIHPPRAVTVRLSADGTTFGQALTAEPDAEGGRWRWEGGPATVRAVRGEATSVGQLPAGQPGAGTPGWLFAGEVLLHAD